MEEKHTIFFLAMKKRKHQEHWPQGQVDKNNSVPLSHWFDKQISQLLLGHNQK